MVEAWNKKIDKAVKKLTTLNEITLNTKRSSNYSFGLIKPVIHDRLNITIQLSADSTVQCQILFDNKAIDFPPDILFSTLPEIIDISKLLPQDKWDLDKEDCLYTWFEGILTWLIKKPAVSVVQPKLSFLEEKKGKKRNLLDKDEENERENLPKAKKAVVRKIDLDLDDGLEDFDLEDTKKSVSQDYKIKYEDDYKIKYEDDYKIEYEDNDIVNDLEFKDVDMVESEDEFKFKNKGKHKSISQKDVDKKDYKSKFKDDYRHSLFSDDEDEDVFEFDMASTSKSTYFKSAPKSTMKKPSFGSIQANLASFRKKKTEPVKDIFSFPSSSEKEESSFKPSIQKQRRSLHHQQTKLFDLGSVKEKQDDFRKLFMTAWLTKYRNHIMIYDTKNYAYFSLYMTIKLPVLCDAWAEYKEFKSISLENLGNPTISSPKSNAPIIISFKMEPDTFPSSKLKIQLISVMNTTLPGSSEADTESFEFQVNQKENVDETITAIMRLIKKKIPPFHLQMGKE